MEDDWESGEQDVVIRPKTDNLNKWEGEDDDEDVKESWEDEEEKRDEEKSESKPVEPAKSQKSNKSQKAKLEEQQLAEREEAERLANLTPEEKLAEKLRLQKIQEESDLKTALDTLGISNVGAGLDAFDPNTVEEFKEFGEALSWKVSHYKESPHFLQFAEDLVRSICVNLSAADMKKVKISIENLHTEKLKLEKQTSKKPANKGKAKATLRTENDDIDGYKKYGNDFDDEYDDFM